MNKRNAARAKRVALDRIRFDFATGYATRDEYRATLRNLGFGDSDRLPTKVRRAR